jgi:hypothetical protein
MTRRGIDPRRETNPRTKFSSARKLITLDVLSKGSKFGFMRSKSSNCQCKLCICLLNLDFFILKSGSHPRCPDCRACCRLLVCTKEAQDMVDLRGENGILRWGKDRYSVPDRKRRRDSLITGLSGNLVVWLCAGSAIYTEAVPKMGLDQSASLSQKRDSAPPALTSNN